MSTWLWILIAIAWILILMIMWSHIIWHRSFMATFVEFYIRYRKRIGYRSIEITKRKIDENPSVTDRRRLSVLYRSNSVPVRVCGGPFRSFHPELGSPVDPCMGTAERARARMFLAALTSLSISSPHAGQTCILTDRSFFT